ncbi:MAG: 7TM domain-containing protein, partial [bacterium]
VKLEKISFLPFIIIIIISEQFCITQIENKIKNLFLLFLQTILIGYLTYLIIFSKTIQLIMFFFPENLLSIIGILILIGRYTELRLTELWKFQSLKNV